MSFVSQVIYVFKDLICEIRIEKYLWERYGLWNPFILNTILNIQKSSNSLFLITASRCVKHLRKKNLM